MWKDKQRKLADSISAKPIDQGGGTLVAQRIACGWRTSISRNAGSKIAVFLPLQTGTEARRSFNRLKLSFFIAETHKIRAIAANFGEYSQTSHF